MCHSHTSTLFACSDKCTSWQPEVPSISASLTSIKSAPLRFNFLWYNCLTHRVLHVSERFSFIKFMVWSQKAHEAFAKNRFECWDKTNKKWTCVCASTSHILTNNKYVLLYNTGWISRDLAFIRSFVFFHHGFDFELPIVWVLKFDFISTIARIRLLSYSQQFKTTFARLSSNPRYLYMFFAPK